MRHTWIATYVLLWQNAANPRSERISYEKCAILSGSLGHVTAVVLVYWLRFRIIRIAHYFA